MRMAWSPNLTNEDFPLDYNDWKFEDKIRLFEDQVLGWQLLIANDIINVHSDTNRHAGFAVLSILLSYFEMIGKYLEGYIGERQSEKHFKIGLLNVFPYLIGKNKVIRVLYEDTRCGMYHEALIGKRVILTRNYNTPIFAVDENYPIIAIDPHVLTTTLINHFKNYIKQVKASNQSNSASQNFINRFDFLKRGKATLQREMLIEDQSL